MARKCEGACVGGPDTCLGWRAAAFQQFIDNLNVVRVAWEGKFDSPHVESYILKMVRGRAGFPYHWNQVVLVALFWRCKCLIVRKVQNRLLKKGRKSAIVRFRPVCERGRVWKAPNTKRPTSSRAQSRSVKAGQGWRGKLNQVRKADDRPVSSGLADAKKPVNPLSSGFVRFRSHKKRP
jgi:hypothetical protein